MKKQRTGPRGLWILPLWRSTYILAVAIAMPRYAIFSIMSGFLSIRVRFWLCGKSTRRVWPVQEMIVVANVLLLLYYCFRFTNTEAAINLECKSIVDNRLWQENGLTANSLSSLLSSYPSLCAFFCSFLASNAKVQSNFVHSNEWIWYQIGCHICNHSNVAFQYGFDWWRIKRPTFTMWGSVIIW